MRHYAPTRSDIGGLRVDILKSNGGRAETSMAMTHVMLPKRIKLDLLCIKIYATLWPAC